MKKANPIVRLIDAAMLRLGKIVHFSRDIYYQRSNIDKPKLLVFTDSRGYEVVKPWNRKSAYASYVGDLCKEYNVEYVICPEFSTTVIDFLYEYQQRIAAGKQYDAVVAHVGVVDYSPRPVSMLEDMMKVKRHKIESLFPATRFDFDAYHAIHFEQLYFGKPVANFYSKVFLTEEIMPLLKQIDNLIMIGCSPVLTDWQGNYWRERPANMGIILDYSALCRTNLLHFIDYSEWTSDEVKCFTIDNIHLSGQGFEKTYTHIKEQLAKLGL